MSTIIRLAARLALALLATCTSLTALARALPADDVERGANRVAEALLVARDGEATLSSLLDALDDGELPLLFETLGNGRFPVRVGERGNSTRALNAMERASLAQRVARCAQAELEAHLERRLLLGPDSDERVAALSVLAHADLSARELIAWSTPVGERERVPSAVRNALTASLRVRLRRDPDDARVITRSLRDANLSLLPPLLGALRASPGNESLAALFELFGLSPTADALVLMEVAHMGGSVHQPVAASLRARVRAFLHSGADSTCTLEAVGATQSLGDVDAIPELIDLLGHPRELVRERARRSLEHLTNQYLGQRQERWEDWYGAALDWWRDESGDLLSDVSHGRPGEAAHAILELSKRRLFRHELSEYLVAGLARSERELVILTCAALGHLGSSLVVDALLETLGSEDVELRRAAYLALKRISAEDHGELPEDWRSAGW